MNLEFRHLLCQTQDSGLVSQFVRGYWTSFVVMEVACEHSLSLSINGILFFNLHNHFHKCLKITLSFNLLTE